MSRINMIKPLAIALGTALLGALSMSPAAFAQYSGGMQNGNMQNNSMQNQQIQQMQRDQMMNHDKSMDHDKMADDHVAKMMEAMDTDKDGYISQSEHTAYMDAQFKKADTNGDGKLSKDELENAMKAMHHDDTMHH